MAANQTVVDIGSKLSLLSGFPFPSSKFSSSEGFPLIRIRDVVASNVETYYRGPVLPQYVVREGDVLVGMDGDFNVAKWRNGDALLNQRVLKVGVLSPDDLDPAFMFYWLQPYVAKINEITAATTVKHLSTKDLQKARALIPSIESQRVIGRVLETADQAIEKTEALIEKYQQIKAGLMHDLFTRGIAADGKLRPPREQAPELYQETPIGWIPKDWCLVTLSAVCEVDSGITLGAHRRPGANAQPYLRVANVFAESIDMADVAKMEASQAEVQKLGLKSFDLLVVEGHANIEQIARCAMVDDDAEGLLFQNHLFRLTAKKIRSRFMLYWLNSHLVRSYWRRTCSTSSGLNTINRTMLGNVPVVYPSSTEQRSIEGRLRSVADYIAEERIGLSKLQMQKAGLMSDLLSGNVEVANV